MRTFLLLSLVLATMCSADPAATAAPSATRPVVIITTSKGDITCELFADQAPQTVANFLGLVTGSKPDGATRPFYDGLTFHRVIPGFMIQGGDPQGDGSGGPGFAFPDEINAVSLGLDKELALAGPQQLHPHADYMLQQFSAVELRPRLAKRGIGPQTPKAEQDAAVDAVLAELKELTLLQFYSDLGYKYDNTLPPSTRPVKGMLAMANSGPGTNGSQFFINLADTPHLTGKHTVFGRVLRGMNVAEAIAAVPANQQNNRPVTAVLITAIRLATTPP